MAKKKSQDASQANRVEGIRRKKGGITNSKPEMNTGSFQRQEEEEKKGIRAW